MSDAVTEETLLHGTCVTLGERGVLIVGPAGSGKSDLALRLIDEESARLVADDQVIVRRDVGRLVALAPASLAGRMEIRGLGIVTVAHVARSVLALAVQLREAARIERLPELAGQNLAVLGLRLPLVEIDAAAASATARVRAALIYCASPLEPTR